MVGNRASWNHEPLRKRRGEPSPVTVCVRLKDPPPSHICKLIEAVIHTQVRLTSGSWVGCSSPFMRLAEQLTALRALVQANVCLVWWKPDILRPGIVEMWGSMVTRLRPCTNLAHSRPPAFLLRGSQGRIWCSRKKHQSPLRPRQLVLCLDPSTAHPDKRNTDPCHRARQQLFRQKTKSENDGAS